MSSPPGPGRHRRGRAVTDLPAAPGNPTTGDPTSGATRPTPAATVWAPRWTLRGREPYARAQQTRTGLDGRRLYSAASQARRDGQDALVAITGSKARVRDTGSARRRTAREVEHATAALERTDGLLQQALAEIDDRRAHLHDVERALRQLRGHGGRLIASRPTALAAENRVARAVIALHDAEATAGGLVTALHRVAFDAEFLAHHVITLADHTLAHPPAALHLVRVLLPRSERSNWWRELSSTLAETTNQGERRTQVRSYLTAAPRTVWTSWSVARRRNPREAPDHQ